MTSPASPAPLRVLTGITPSGTPHLGNYVGAIRPAVAASRTSGIESFFFLADLHSLIKAHDPARTQRSTLEIAASWLAAGLDPDHVTFYRQSDIPEIPELTWLLTCVCGKGLLNRAHAYKAQVDKNAAAGEEPDAGVTMGLFMYPVLMAADILLFKAHRVPVGRDQIQHIEMARDMAASFNHIYGEHLVLPEAAIDEHVATLPGLDGRKMSKSYGNTIALFGPREQLRKQIMGIVTDSRAPGEAKDAESAAIFQLYRAFASPDEAAQFRQALTQGIGWGEAKEQLFERIDREISPMRARYDHYMTHPQEVETAFVAGAQKARALAASLMRTLRQAVGLRSLDKLQIVSVPSIGVAAEALPTFKQYREANGRFYFKLADAQGRALLQSRGFESPREAGQAIKRLQTEGAAALAALAAQLDEAAGQPLDIAGAALERLRLAQAAKPD
jgi:tryptophanyl-tRNA synthetase